MVLAGALGALARTTARSRKAARVHAGVLDLLLADRGARQQAHRARRRPVHSHVVALAVFDPVTVGDVLDGISRTEARADGFSEAGLTVQLAHRWLSGSASHARRCGGAVS